MRFCVAPSSTEHDRTIILLPKHRTHQWTDSSTARLSIHILNSSILTPQLHGLIALVSTATPPEIRLPQHNHHSSSHPHQHLNMHHNPIPQLIQTSTLHPTQLQHAHKHRYQILALPYPLSSSVQISAGFIINPAYLVDTHSISISLVSDTHCKFLQLQLHFLLLDIF